MAENLLSGPRLFILASPFRSSLQLLGAMPMTSVMSPFDRLRELEKKRFHKERRGQVPVMDAETLRELCLDNDGYETPELNDSLYAHFRGFQRIEGLDAYYNLKALWLESNGLSRIENLEPLVNLRCLYLGKNLIEKVENLHTLRELNTLDLSENRIQSLAGVAQLPNLLSLNASGNRLKISADLQELAKCPLLNNVDISHNLIEDPETLGVIKAIPLLKALRITGNPVVSSTRSFRKTYIAALPQLSFLDRPIFPIERASVTAWESGGIEAEREAKRAFVNQENEERRRSLQEFREWQAEVRERRIKQLELERAQKLLETTPEAESEEIEVDLRGFRAITKEEYVAMDAAERAKWDVRIKEAHADSEQAKYEVLGNGIEQMGAKFWANSAPIAPEISATNTSDLPVHDAEPPFEDPFELESLPQTQVAPDPVDAAEKTAAAEVEVAGNSGSDAHADISLIDTSDVAVRTAAASEGEDEQATTRAKAELDECNARSPVVGLRSVNSAAALSGATRTQPDLPPPAPVAALWSVNGTFGRDSEPRETWDQLQQRASAAPFRLRPQSLPSAFAPEDSDERAEEGPANRPTAGQDASPVRVLRRADILRELDGTQRQQHKPGSTTFLQESLGSQQEESTSAAMAPPAPTKLYTNVRELD